MGSSKLQRIDRTAAAALAGLLCLAEVGAVAPADRPVTLSELLDHLGQTARLYVDNAFRFTCRETITHYTDRGRRQYQFDYIYVPGEEGRIAADYRLPHRRKPPSEKGKKSPAVRPVSVTDYGLPGVLDRPYMWVLFFDRALQGSRLYSYELAGRSEVLGRQAVGLRFEPRRPISDEVDNWFGTAWVDLETYQLLRVEAIHASDQKKKRRFEQDLRSAARSGRRHRSTHLFQQVYTDYGIVREGIRFPSEVMLRRSRYEIWGEGGSSGYHEYPVFRVKQSYSNYRFFGVETEQQIQPPPPS